MKKWIKILAWILLAIVLLVAAFVSAVMVINKADRPVSALSESFQRYYDENLQKDIANNAYALMFGFDVPQTEDPEYWGYKRIEWTYQNSGSADANTISEYPEPDHKGAGMDIYNIPGFNESCISLAAGCITKALSEPEATEETLIHYRWVIERYTHLISMSEFAENSYNSIQIPFPPYSQLITAQRMYLMDILLSSPDSGENFQKALEKDLVFWRQVQKNSIFLITKLIATTAIKQNLFMANELYRHVTPEDLGTLSPSSLSAPFNQDELSLYRVLVGEWIFSKSFLEENLEYYKAEEDLNEFGFWAELLTSRLLQPQDTLNRHAENLSAYLDHYNRPLHEYPEAIKQEVSIAHYSSWQFLYDPYNPAGRFLVSVALPAYENYFLQIADLEGARRAVLLTALLRQQFIDSSAAEEFITHSPIRNPYTNEPFQWDAELEAVVFIGLQTGDRAKHVYRL